LFHKLYEHGIEVDFDMLKNKKKPSQELKAFNKSNFKEFKLDAEFDTGLPKG
jgi:hypothetical protein